MYNVGYQFVSPVGLVSPLMPPLSPLPGTFSFGLLDRGGANQRAQSLMTLSCLRLRGLPFSATKDDIVTFLGHHSQGVIGTVHIIYNLQVSGIICLTSFPFATSQVVRYSFTLFEGVFNVLVVKS